MDPLILARRPDLVMIKEKTTKKKRKKRKKNLPNSGGLVLANHMAKLKEGKKKDKSLDLARELKKTMEHEGDCDTTCNWFDR